jgi:hypothetical protein
MRIRTLLQRLENAALDAACRACRDCSRLTVLVITRLADGTLLPQDSGETTEPCPFRWNPGEKPVQ